VVLLTAFVAAGMAGIVAAVGRLAGTLAVAVTVLALLAVVICAHPKIRPIAFWPGVVVIPLLALIGFNVLWGLSPLGRLDLVAGLIVAIVVFALAATLYMWLREPLSVSALIAVPLAVLFVIGAPLLIGALTAGPQDVAAARNPVSTRLDLLIVVPAHPAHLVRSLEPEFAPESWDVRYSVARVNGTRLHWVLLGSDSPRDATRAAEGVGGPVAGAPQLRHDADHALVLDVDGTPATVADPLGLPQVAGGEGEIRRWRRIAAAAAPLGTPAFALLQTIDHQRIARWNRALGEGGGALSIQREGSQALTDTAFHAATTGTTAQQDLALAFRYRPILLFDGREPQDRPVDVESIFAAGRMHLCHDDATRTECATVSHASQLENGLTHLHIDLPRPRKLEHDRTPVDPDQLDGHPPPGPTADTSSAIYVHPVPRKEHGRQMLYLDYWWYLPDNPAGTAEGATCGAGLAIPGITCFDHESDWEGVTVVVDRTEAQPALVAVQYAQHDSVIRYSWDQLRAIWDTAGYSEFTRGIDDAADRPLVFSARGTHASYPQRCSQGCEETANGLGEQPHRGNDPWPGDYARACTVATCLRPLPTRDHGSEPALWDAYTGTWGRRHCVLHYICDSNAGPHSPGQQGRYQEPWRFSGTVDARGRFIPADGGESP
jgi:hypothetical protein